MNNEFEYNTVTTVWLYFIKQNKNYIFKNEENIKILLAIITR